MKKNIGGYLIYAIALFGILYLIYYFLLYPIVRSHYFSLETRYSITTKVSSKRGAKGAITYFYSFKIKGEEYENFSNIYLSEKGIHYFVKFYPPNPKYNEAIKVIATEKDLENLPVDGYKELPHR